ncbi:MAG TPA: XRE family transcriptional regulator [Thermodesulfobacteriota bacterium]|nr:XRE family transcriptional regulator [Thermodesulfobacteriota bacterium]
MLGDRIKQARIGKGLSLRGLAEKTGNYISAQVIHKYELGKAMPGSDVLIHLAKALDIKVEYFFRPESVQVTLSPPAYRKRRAVSLKHLQSMRAMAKEWVERYLEVESLFPDNRFMGGKIPAPVQRIIKKINDVENLAVILRKLWVLGTDPIENLTEVLEDHGVKVVMLEGEEEFDGLSCWANDKIPVILLKKGLSGDRQRSSLAHELGHLIMDVSSNVDEEKAAFRFSGAFLVPEEVVYQELGRQRNTIDLGELVMLKKKYGMSMQQWIYRTRDLSVISESRAIELFRLFRLKGWHRNEPGEPVPPEEPGRFKRLILQAVTEGLISPVRAAEFLGKPFNEFRKSLQVELA